MFHAQAQLQIMRIKLAHQTVQEIPYSIVDYDVYLPTSTLVVFDITPTLKHRVQNLPNFPKTWPIPIINILHI